MIKLESKRLIIRDHIESDLDAVHSWISAEFVMTFLDWRTDSINQTKKYLRKTIKEAKSHNRTRYFFATEIKESGQIIGDVGFTI
jgi:ribosomal-protein-alanine N-acetyltransferase